MFSVPTIVFVTLSLVLILGALIARIRHLQRQDNLEAWIRLCQQRRLGVADTSDDCESGASALLARRRQGRNRTSDEDLAFPSNPSPAPSRVRDDCGSDGND